MALTAAEVFRDNVTAGVPSSGIHEPKKSEIRTLLSDYERTLDAALEGASLVFVSKAALDARLDHAASTSAWVIGDASVANNGIYAKVGASGTGSWLRVADLPYSFIVAEDVGAGTPNAIVATTDVPVSGSALIILNLFETNTASPVTVSFNGGSPLTVKTASGSDPVAGGLTGRLLGTISESSFVLASDQASAAIQAAAEAAVDDAQGWAEGTLPGGAGTKSSREWSEVSEDWALIAQSAVTFNRVSVRGTINAGVGPYDVGVPIGSANNIDIKVGGVIFDHNLYTVDGTMFTFLTDPGAGQPWEGVVQTEVRELGAPSDGTVSVDSFSTSVNEYLDGRYSQIISAEMFGAVFDGAPEDQAKIKEAAMAAVAAGLPFVVPNRGLTWNEGLVLRVPEDFATVQAAHDATLNWIFPAYPPRLADTTQNHIFPVALTISVAAGDHVHDGKNITWNHPHGQLIMLKGRDKKLLSLASQQAITFVSGTHPARLRFNDWPDVDPQVGSVLHMLVLTGSGAYQNFEGAWRISAVNAANKDITFAAYARTDTTALVATIGGGLFYHIPTILRFVNQPDSGADVGCIDVHTTLRMSDIAIIGSPSNAASSNGLIAREGAKILLDQHCSAIEHRRSGLWLLNDAYAQIGYAAFCGNDSGINNLQSIVDGTRVSVQGNFAFNYIGGIGSSGSIVQSAFGGAGQAGILVNNNASLICSGHSRRSDFGIDVKPGGFANINDLQCRANVTTDVRRRGGGRIMLTANDSGTFVPALATGDSFGGFTALSSTLDAVS